MLDINYKLRPLGELDIFDIENIPDDMRYRIIKQGKKYVDYDWKSIKASVYTSDSRDEFARIYRERRIALSALALSEVIEKNGELLCVITHGIWALCD